MLFKYLQEEGAREGRSAAWLLNGGRVGWAGAQRLAVPRGGQLCLLACGQKLRQEGVALSIFPAISIHRMSTSRGPGSEPGSLCLFKHMCLSCVGCRTHPVSGTVSLV